LARYHCSVPPLLRPIARRRRRRRLPRGLRALLLSAGVHLALVLALWAWGAVSPAPAPRSASLPVLPQEVALQALSPEQWEHNRGPTAQPRTAPERALAERKAPASPKAPEARPEGQVVDVAPGNDQVAPDAKYLAESNNRVLKQTRAKEQTPHYRNAMPHRTATQASEGQGADAVQQAQRAGNEGVGDDDRPLTDEARRRMALEIPDVRRQEELALRPDPIGPGARPEIANRAESAEVRGNAERLRIQAGDPTEHDEGSAQGRSGSPGVAHLAPSMAVLDKVAGAAANDHLRDVEEGQSTFLNTREWKYATFFNRVKQSVSTQWRPGEELRQRDPTFKLYGGRDRHTVVHVTLDDRGRLKEIFVEKSSGLDFLDLEAIRSFERAQPFPNPPAGLVAQDATIRFSFAFFVEMEGGPARTRLFRRAN
jgi:TonB family protein